MIAAVDYAIGNGMPREIAEKAAYIVYRGEQCFVCLNAYPYSTGHVMILPYQHLDSLAGLPPAAAQELMELAQRAETVLREVYRPDGLNMGLNLGQAAGAGIADHIHLHALPRWSGDTNFMTVTAETRVLPEALDTTWGKFRLHFQNIRQPNARRDHRTWYQMGDSRPSYRGHHGNSPAEPPVVTPITGRPRESR